MSERAIKCAKWAKIKYLTNIIIPLKSFGSLGSLVFFIKMHLALLGAGPDCARESGQLWKQVGGNCQVACWEVSAQNPAK